MNFIKQRRLQKQQKLHLITIMKEFLEGNMTVYEFWDIFKKNEDMRNLLISDSLKNRKFATYYDPEHLLERVNLEKLRDRVEIFWTIERYLKNNKLSFIRSNIDEEYFNFLTNLQPNWLELDEDYLDKIVKSAPKGMTRTEIVKWSKTKIKEMFIYEHKPPQWLQNPEWPIIKGTPLIFNYQSGDIDDYTISKINYYFYNPETDEEVIIEQFD